MVLLCEPSNTSTNHEDLAQDLKKSEGRERKLAMSSKVCTKNKICKGGIVVLYSETS